VMFCVSETQAAIIRAAFEQRGELAAALELRRLFPGVNNIVLARKCVCTIAGWPPLPVHLLDRRGMTDDASYKSASRMGKRSKGSAKPGSPLRRWVQFATFGH